MVYGDRRPYPVALITVNPEELGKFAREQGILTTDPARRHQAPEGRGARGAHRRGEELAAPVLREDQEVHACCPIDFTQEGGELTPTLKVKRKVVSEKYRQAIEELYR